MSPKAKVRLRKPGKYKRLWHQLVGRFNPVSREASAEEADTARAYVFCDGEKFQPKALADALQAEFDPIVSVGGFFYHYDPCGVWRLVEEDELGKKASMLLGRAARTSWIMDATQLLRYAVNRRRDAFLPQPGVINLQNGMLKVAARRLYPHRAKYNSRIQLPYAFDPEAKCPRWQQFLKEVFADEPDKAKVLCQWFGYCLTEEVFLQQFLVLIGSGSNGKSVALSVLGELVGKENRCAIALDRMQHDFVLVELRDKLVNISGEIETSKQLDASIMKVLTGEDAITVNKKYCDPVTFRPTAKHTFAVNQMPRFADRTYAMRRRALFLDFRKKFTGCQRDPHLAGKLREELPGILNWALDGLEEVLKTKEIYRPPSSLEMERVFAESLNPVLAFVKRACVLEGQAPPIRRHELYELYSLWHRDNIGEHPLSPPAFYERLREDFPAVQEVRRHGYDNFKGIRVVRGPRILVKRGKWRGKKGKGP